MRGEKKAVTAVVDIINKVNVFAPHGHHETLKQISSFTIGKEKKKSD